MPNSPRKLTATFERFFESEKSSGIVLLACTAFSLLLANSAWGTTYLAMWDASFAGISLGHAINDGLMAIFFLMIGLELKRELINGELSNLNTALLPLIAALGGVAVPALIHLSLNRGLLTQPGIGIPMATDIAFALGALAILGKSIPTSLKVFVMAFAVIDDLCAIIVIAVFYSHDITELYLGGVAIMWIALFMMNRAFKINQMWPYLLAGTLLWYCMLRSGVHATVAGVITAFALPFSAQQDDAASVSHRLENLLHRPVAFGILPLFALSNTGVVIAANWAGELASSNSLGIMIGLIAGKPIGITLACFAAVSVGLCKLPGDLRWSHVIGAGMLGGIGFTMSIFITNLAFDASPSLINSSKMAILLASFLAGVLGLLWLRLFAKPQTASTS